MYFGIKMVEKWDGNKKKILISTVLPGMLLGFTSAIRFLGPYAAILIFLFFLSRSNGKSNWWGFISYGIVAFATMVALWPFLWINPIQQFIVVLKAMSTATPSLRTLFMGTEYHVYELPRRYLPVLFTITLSEPTWPLFIIGFITAIYRSLQKKIDRAKLTTIFLWFGLTISALIGFNPPGWMAIAITCSSYRLFFYLRDLESTKSRANQNSMDAIYSICPIPLSLHYQLNNPTSLSIRVLQYICRGNPKRLSRL